MVQSDSDPLSFSSKTPPAMSIAAMTLLRFPLSFSFCMKPITTSCLMIWSDTNPFCCISNLPNYPRFFICGCAISTFILALSNDRRSFFMLHILSVLLIDDLLSLMQGIDYSDSDIGPFLSVSFFGALTWTTFWFAISWTNSIFYRCTFFIFIFYNINYSFFQNDINLELIYGSKIIVLNWE